MGIEREFNVYRLNADGETIGCETYFNSLSPRENMITSCLHHHGRNNVIIKSEREWASKQIRGMEGQRLMFFIGDEVFISQNLRKYEN